MAQAASDAAASSSLWVRRKSAPTARGRAGSGARLRGSDRSEPKAYRAGRMVGLSAPSLSRVQREQGEVAQVLAVTYTGCRITHEECGRVSRPNRVEIWSVLAEDQRLYAWLFPSFWLLGAAYHAFLRFRVLEDSVVLTIGEFSKDVGIVGLSAAVLAIMVIAGRRLTVALFDWGNRTKTLARGRQEGEKELARRLASMTPEEREAEIKRLASENSSREQQPA